MAIALQVGWHGAKTGSEAPRFPADRKRCWSEDSEKMLQLMMGQVERRSETLDLLETPSATAQMELELESEKPLPSGWEKCLDLKTGTVYYVNSTSGKKTLHDPREVFQSKRTRQSVSETTKLSNGESFSRGDCMKQESSMSCASVLTWRLMEQMPDRRSTRIVTSSTSKELFQSVRKPSERLEAQLIDAFEKREENESPAPAADGLADSSLDLKLNLEPTSILAKAVKDSALSSWTDSLSDHLQKKSTLETKTTELSTTSFWQSDAAQPRTCLAEPSTSTPAASSPSSSAHSLWSFQTPTDHRPQSGKGGGSRSSSSEAHESKKMDGGGDQPLVIVGCANCLMYVMLSKVDPRCPRCGSSVLLDFPNNSDSSSKRPRLA